MQQKPAPNTGSQANRLDRSVGAVSTIDRDALSTNAKFMHIFERTLVVLIFLCSAVHAEVIENFDISYYPVSLHSGSTLISQFNAASSIRENGEIFHGNTHWDIHWSFRWNTDASGRCRLISVNTKLDVVMTLPDAKGADTHQLAVVTSYSRALRMHEQGHYDIARRAARDIDQSLLAMPGMNDCKTLDIHANAKGYELLERYNELSRQYDKDTRHGRTQGAFLNE